MKKFSCLIMLMFLLARNISAQQYPCMAVVVFADGKYYHGKILQETADILRVQFLVSNSIYEFNKLGVITKSNGKYKAGGLVKLISLHDFINDVYNEENSYYPYNYYGVRFGDGQLYFALADDMKFNKLTAVYFTHSGSRYEFIKESGKWKVSSSNGAYPVGHVIKSLYRLQNFGRIFFADLSMIKPDFLQKRPTGSDN